MRTFKRGDSIQPVSFPDISVPVDAFLPNPDADPAFARRDALAEPALRS